MNQTVQAFGYPETVIKEYEHWVVLLRPEQVTVGSLVIVEKSEARYLGDLPRESWSEFAQVSSEMENLLRDIFGAEKFNYLALMMKDPNVHFHFIPRYSKPVLFEEVEYADVDWPSKTEMSVTDMPEDVFEKLKSRLLDRLG